MSSQSSGHAPVPFSITTPLRNVRLMEVPEELLEVITSASASAGGGGGGGAPVLKFKSAAAQTEPVMMHLCSADRAWGVKQVSTSNSVYVVRPSRTVAVEGEGDDVEMAGTDAVDVGLSTGAVTAMAQVGNFLELYPVKFDVAVVEREVVKLLPVLHLPLDEEGRRGKGEEPDLDLLAANDAKTAMSLGRLVDDVSAPDQVVKNACARLCVFESESGVSGRDGGGVRCQIPSTRTLFNVWAKIVEGCAIEGVKLDVDEVSLIRVVNVLSDEVEEKIAEKMFEIGGLLDSSGLFEEDRRRLKPAETSHFVAGLLLSSRSKGADGHRQMEVDDFTAKWTDLVPSSFVKSCTVESLVLSAPGLFAVSRDGDGATAQIRWIDSDSKSPQDYALASDLTVDPNVGSAGVNSSAAKPVAAAASSAADKKRKWHEKFGAQRNAKK